MDIAMFALPFAFIFSVVSLFILRDILDHKVKKAIAISVAAISLCCIVIRFFGIKLNPEIELYLGLIMTAIALTNLIVIINEKLIGTVLTVAVILVFGFFYGIYSPVIKDASVENVEYTCTYPKLTGIGETRANYYEKVAFIFVKSQPTFVENYGIYLGGWEDVLDREPYEVYYYD